MNLKKLQIDKMLAIAKSLQQKNEALASSENYVRVKLNDAQTNPHR